MNFIDVTLIDTGYTGGIIENGNPCQDRNNPGFEPMTSASELNALTTELS